MENTRFPAEIGELGNKTFIEAFNQCPKIVEFADSLWVSSKTTGLFKLFLTFVKNRLTVPEERAAHEIRCQEFVLGKKEVPSYLKRFKEPSQINTI